MTGDLIINGKDAWTTWMVAMGEGFLESLLITPPIKDFIESESRLEDGKRVISNDPKIASRELTLLFNIHGNSKDDYLENYKSFCDELKKAVIIMEVPYLGEKYKLIYKKSASFSLSFTRMDSKLSVKFEEPNPADRK